MRSGLSSEVCLINQLGSVVYGKRLPNPTMSHFLVGGGEGVIAYDDDCGDKTSTRKIRWGDDNPRQ